MNFGLVGARQFFSGKWYSMRVFKNLSHGTTAIVEGAMRKFDNRAWAPQEEFTINLYFQEHFLGIKAIVLILFCLYKVSKISAVGTV